ncbi:hypothetical protein WJX81_006547 [Elliptochloris bilobata]|uniref:Uncharacterized protein n=1 Tax=Elliptochloris bilobata TaxID=381761 RepID=A0AAW1RDF0_9CHLO
MREKELGGSTRKPYRVSKQRCPWSTAEHALFLEAIDRYGRAWPKIVAHIGTRSVQQVRSHAQKYFLKLEKAGNQDAVPPPRPKKRSARPYPTLANRRERGGRQSDESGGEESEGGNGSNCEHSDGTCADGSAHSTGNNVCPSGLELGLDVPCGSIAVPPAKQDICGLGGQQVGVSVQAAALRADALASEAAAPGNNDFGRLYSLVGSLCEAESKAKQRMLEQLEPSQRASLATMMGYLTGNLRAAGSSGATAGCNNSGVTPFAAPAVQAPAAAAQLLANGGGARLGYELPALLEPFGPGPGLESGRGLQLDGRLLDESSSVPQLVGLPSTLAPQPDAELLMANPTPAINAPSDVTASLASSEDRLAGGLACEVDGGTRSGSFTGGSTAALGTDLARAQLLALAQQHYAQAVPQMPPGVYAEQLRQAAQLAHHQLELAQAQAQLLPHPLLSAPLHMGVETTQPAPSVPADFLLKWQAECDPWPADVDPAADLAVPGLFAF